MLHGIDTSFAQGDIRWQEVHGHGQIAFAYHRATFGSNPDNDDGQCFADAHDECKRLGIPFGSYHFYTEWDDPVEQAQHFLQAANGRYGDLMVMVDVEEASFRESIALPERIARLGKCLSTIQAAVGQPLIYTDPNTWETYLNSTDGFSGHKLWVANYDVAPGQPDVPTGFKTWVVHQYSATGVVRGIDGAVDMDVLNGNDLSLIKRG